MKTIYILLFTLCLCVGSFGQKLTIFENAPAIDGLETQQLKNFAEFEGSYFYTTRAYDNLNQRQNSLVKVNKTTGKLEMNDKNWIGTYVTWLTATDKYIYYPVWKPNITPQYYSLNRYDPKTNVHETMKSKTNDDNRFVFSSTNLRSSALYSFKNKLVTISHLGEIDITSSKMTTIINDSDAFAPDLGFPTFHKENSVSFYSDDLPTDNTLTIANNRFYAFYSNYIPGKYFVYRLIKFEDEKFTEYNVYNENDKEKSSFFPCITANDERGFTLKFTYKEKYTNDPSVVKLVEIDTKGSANPKEVATISLDKDLHHYIQMNIVGDSVYISDRWHLYEYNYKTQKTTLLLKLQPNERFYKIQNGKRFHFADDGTIFYKKLTDSSLGESIGMPYIFAFDKTKLESKSLFQANHTFENIELIGLHKTYNNVYFLGNKVVDFKVNSQTNILEVHIYDKNGTVTNMPMPVIKKLKPSTYTLGSDLVAIQTKDAIVFNYGYRNNKKEEQIVVMKLSE